MVRTVVIVLLLAGCDIVFRLDDLRGDGSINGDGKADSGPSVDAPADCMHDTFSGTDIKQQWSLINELGAFTVSQNDRIEIGLPVDYKTNAEAGLETYRRYNFIGAFVQVEVPSVVTSTTYNAENYLAARIDNTNGYVIRVANGGIDFWTWFDGILTDNGGRPYDATAHRWWRIEHMPGDNTIRFLTSANAQSWDMQGTGNATVPLTSIQVTLRAGNLVPGDPNPGRAIYDNFLLCPAIISP